MTEQQAEAVLANPKSWVPNKETVEKECEMIARTAVLYKKGKRERWHAAWRALEAAFPLGRGRVCNAIHVLVQKSNRPKHTDLDVCFIINKLRDIADILDAFCPIHTTIEQTIENRKHIAEIV